MTSDAAEHPPIRLLIAGPGGSREELFEKDEVSFGRSTVCDVVLHAPYVSRNHAVLRQSDNGLMIQDCGSRNGVFVNHRRVTQDCELSVGDVVEIGPFSITVIEPTSQEPTTQDFHAWQQRLTVDPDAHTVEIDGAALTVSLSPQEFELLCILYVRHDKVVSRDQIGCALWGKGNFDANMVHRLVRRLRLKLEPDPTAPRFVHAAPGVGYMLRVGRETSV